MPSFLNKLFSSATDDDIYPQVASQDGPIHVTDEEFSSVVLQSALPVVSDFWAPWCMPCRMIAPALESLAKEFAGRAVVAKVNTDENPEWAIKYGVQGIPTLLFIKDGEVVDRIVGVASAGRIKALLEQYL